MNTFQFCRTPRIIFGRGSLGELGACASSFGGRALLLTGASSLKASGALLTVETVLRDSKMEFMRFIVHGEPSPALIDDIVKSGGVFKPDGVIAVGGGSVIDAGKAVSAMLPSGGPVQRFLEGVGTEKPSGKKIPMIAVPTTSGTGSEATANAVLGTRGENGYKKSLRHVNFAPDAAIVDPALAATCPPSVTAACGMDAFAQLLESYVSAKASPMTDALAKSGIECVRDSLVPALSGDCENPEARDGMAYAALASGIALANAGLGLVHGIAGAVGGRFPAPHGAACGALVGPVTRASIAKLMSVDAKHPALRKYAAIGHVLSNRRFDTVENGCDNLLHHIDSWTRKLRIPRLGDYGIGEGDIERIAEESSNKNNPVKFDKSEIMTIVREAL